jgi:hypothetical protein
MKKIFGDLNYCCNFAVTIAKVAQLVEHDLAKVGVAGSSPVFRSKPLERGVLR